VSDDETDLSPVALFEAFPFLAGLDFAPGRRRRRSRRWPSWNGRRIGIPRWPAEPDGVSIAVFD
jgi:hypothetical protein